MEGYHIGGVDQERWVYPWVFHLLLWGVVWSSVSCDLWEWGYVNIARLIAVQCLVSFVNHKNTLKDCFTFHISPQNKGVQSQLFSYPWSKDKREILSWISTLLILPTLPVKLIILYYLFDNYLYFLSAKGLEHLWVLRNMNFEVQGYFLLGS